MEFKRSDRVADRIRRELSDLILKKVNDPRVGFVTVTRIQCSDDLRNATVYFSILGSEAVKQACMDGLKSALPFLQREVFKRLSIKVPTLLYFKLDDSLEQGSKIDTILKQLRTEREEDDGNDGSPAPS